MAFPNPWQHRHGARARVLISGGISHSRGHRTIPEGCGMAARNHATSIARGTIPCRAAQGTVVLICAWMCGGQGPCGVRTLICTALEDQDASRYSANKAVVQHEMLRWHMGHGDLSQVC